MNENGWISCNERLPEEKKSPMTMDYLEYECTFRLGDFREVRFYKFGGGHWWHGAGIVDDYVIAWRERPEPYKGER